MEPPSNGCTRSNAFVAQYRAERGTFSRRSARIGSMPLYVGDVLLGAGLVSAALWSPLILLVRAALRL